MACDDAKERPLGQAEVEGPIPAARQPTDSPVLALWNGAEIGIHRGNQLADQCFPEVIPGRLAELLLWRLAKLVAFLGKDDDDGLDFPISNQVVGEFNHTQPDPLILRESITMK